MILIPSSYGQQFCPVCLEDLIVTLDEDGQHERLECSRCSYKIVIRPDKPRPESAK